MNHEPLSTLSRSVTGRVVLVTGAASGMGRAIARLFVAEGARVALTDRRAADVDREVAAIEETLAARDGTGEAVGWTLDVTDAAAIEEVVAEVVERLGPIDVLVNNAGVAAGAAIDDPDYEAAWRLAFDVLVTPHMRLVRACLPHLARHGEGRVINIASTEGLGASRNTSPYTAAKHAVVGLTRALAVDLGPRGVTVNAVCPGPILTAMTAGIPPDQRERYARRRVPLRRYGDPEEVAHVVVSLALPAASYVTGAIIPVDGGLVAKND